MPPPGPPTKPLNLDPSHPLAHLSARELGIFKDHLESTFASRRNSPSYDPFGPATDDEEESTSKDDTTKQDKMVSNKSLIFKEIPTGFPEPGKHLVLEDRPVDIENPDLGEEGILIKIHYVSFDPYQRGRMRDPSIQSYSPAFPLNEPITNNTISKVIKSNSPRFKEGDVVSGMANTAEYQIISGKEALSQIRPLNNPHNLPAHYFLGVLGMPGLTAYSSLYEIGKPKKGEIIFVTAASGAVGQLVGQIALHEGLTVIGSAGSDDKVAYLKDKLKFTHAFNYKTTNLEDFMKKVAPDGIDIYYDNVGGPTSQWALQNMKLHGRYIICGAISQYNLPPKEQTKLNINELWLLQRRITIRGFIVGDAELGPKHYKDHQERVGQWLKEGSFIYTDHVTEGIDNAAQGLLDIFHGKNFGKAWLKIADL